jgi:hypothetical protein
MGYDHSLGRNDILQFVYYFMILFVIVYILNIFLLLALFSQHVNLYKYKIFLQ